MEKVLLRLEFELKVQLFNNLIRLRHSIYRIFKECSITVTPCCTVCLATRKNFMLQLTFFFFFPMSEYCELPLWYFSD